MAEFAVTWAGDHFTVDGAELLDPFTEGNDLCGTHKCEVKRIEEQHQVFALVVRQLDIFELPIHYSGARELGGRLGQLQLRHGDHGILKIDNKYSSESLISI